MAVLKEPVKIFIVQALACRDRPQEVIDMVRQEFAIEIPLQQCAAYDPTRPTCRKLSANLKKLFFETRKKFDDGLVDIPIANKHYRMKRYNKLLERNEKNTVMSLKILEQAAKDVGGQFTNKTELTGKDGGALQQEIKSTTVATPEQIREIIGNLNDTY